MDPKRIGIRTERIETVAAGHMSVGVFFLFVAFVVLEVLFLLPEPSFSAETAASPKRVFVEDQILVKFRDGVDIQAKTHAHARVGAKRIKEFKIVPGLELLKLPPGMSVEEAIRLYRENPDVLYAEPNYIAEAQGVPNDPSYGSLWALPKINAPGAWDLSMGSSGVVIATIDTGIDYNHPDLANGGCNSGL
jgi:subtilisin family serine protease